MDNILKNSMIICILILLSGCMAFQNLSMSDIKSDKYYYKSYVLKMPLKEIEVVLYEFGQRCRPLPEITTDPKSGKKAYISWNRYFTANPKIIGLMDFIENEDGTSTTVKAYWYYTSIDGKLSDRIISIIESPEECRDLY